MLQAQFPSLCGLHNLVLGQTLSFQVTQEAFLQILHVGGNHWLTIQKIPSFYVITPFQWTLKNTNLLCTKSSTIVLKIYKTQSQIGTSDCGLFSIAYATDLQLAFEHNPACCEYCQKQ